MASISKQEFIEKLTNINKEMVDEFEAVNRPMRLKCILCNTVTNFSTGHSALRNAKCSNCYKMVLKNKSIMNLANYSLELIQNICNEYINGTSTMQLAEKYLESRDRYSVIASILKVNNINRRNSSQARQKFKINENYFDFINTEEKAYMLGFLYADGGNVGNAIMLALHEKDKEVLFKFSDMLETDKEIKFYQTKTTKYGRLTISNKTLVNRLSELGIVERKTFKIKFPKWLNQNLIKPFIRGYYYDGDGDGGLSITKTKNKGGLTITSNANFIKQLKKIIETYVQINCCIVPIYGKITEKRKKLVDARIKRIAISGNKQIIKLLEWLYDGSSIHLERKYKKFIQLKLNPVSRQ